MTFAQTSIGVTPKAAIEALDHSIDAELAQLVLQAAQKIAGVEREEIRNRLAKRPTGALVRSVQATLLEHGGHVAGAMAAPDTPYARIQDLGGPITAKGKLLPVPFRDTPLGKGPLDYGDSLTLIPRHGKDSILAEVSGKGKNRVVKGRFTLKHEVKIPGVGYIAATLARGDAATEGVVIHRLESAADKASKG